MGRITKRKVTNARRFIENIAECLPEDAEKRLELQLNIAYVLLSDYLLTIEETENRSEMYLALGEFGKAVFESIGE